MATLPTRSQAAIVANIAAGMQGRVSSFLNFAVGSVFLAFAEAYGGICLWLQGLILEVAKLTRLATSYGAGADSFVADFGIIERIGAVAATGLVVFSRFSPSAAAPVIPIGAQLKTTDGTQAFIVYADPTNPAYSAQAAGTAAAPIAGYTMPAQVTSLSVPVVSITAGASGAPGSNGNVAAGAIAIISSQVTGVDRVTNPAAFTNGSDQESDPAFKNRFRMAIASLSKATETAIRNCVAALQTGLQVDIAEGVNLAGQPALGFTAVVDDGSGNPPATLVAAASAAVNATRAAGVPYGLFAAQAQLVSVTMSIVTTTGYDHNTVVAQVAAAIAATINGGGLGSGVEYFQISATALSIPGCINVSNYTLNGGTSDIAGALQLTYKAGTITVS